MRPHLTVEQRQLALRLKARGLSLREIGPQVGCSHQGVGAHRAAGLAAAGPPRWLGARAGTADAGRPGGDQPGPACRGVVHRDRGPAGQGGLDGVAGGGRQRRPRTATGRGGRISGPASRPGGPSAASWPARAGGPGHQLAGRVVVPGSRSPRRLRIEFPDDPMMQVSHETIYQALYVQGRGELRRELARCLRTGRAKRRPRGRVGRHRADQGHGDDQRTARRGRGPGRARPLGRRPDHRQGLQVRGRHPGRAHHPLRDAAAPARRPRRRTGRAGHAAGHQRRCPPSWPAPSPGTRARRWPATPPSPSPPASRSTSATRTQPWQRGSNENTNGLLRQYLPKGTDLSVHTADDLARIARSLNNRPRKTLGFMKPSEKLAELLAHTG